eukprot:jgi/Hompol1/4073/HPOL_000904-RA
MCTKRDLFYSNVSLFETQTRVDRIVDDLACALGVTRSDIKILILASGAVISCNASPKTGVLIPVADPVVSLSVDPIISSVLVVEKDATFLSMLQSGFADTSPNVVLITGKGFPDIATRRLVCMLGNTVKINSDQANLHDEFIQEFGQLDREASTQSLPIEILVDADPDRLHMSDTT